LGALAFGGISLVIQLFLERIFDNSGQFFLKAARGAKI
jgi:hypothetical protein